MIFFSIFFPLEFDQILIFDREYVVRRGLRNDFVVVVVVVVVLWGEHLYKICVKLFPVISGRFWTCVLKCGKVLK